MMQRLLLRILLLMIMMMGLIIESNPSSAIAANIWDHQTTSNISTPQVTVYRSPSCSCCGNWLEHIQKQGLKIQADIKTDDMDTIKQKYNLPQELASCHTAIIDGYVMEGHIPADDIKRFLQQQPQLAGLAVPGMPIGSPGMELGNTQEPFNVMAFNHKGEVQVFKLAPLP
ncbi:MAG TPA: DUF411 domain-containing protein [Trichormus sp. M33_DOE_039]|nr:DUF411 domain-containing protein [Trichormus sp. M33_DOE_039]